MKNTKILSAFLSIALFSTSSFGCQVIFINDSDEMVGIKDTKAISMKKPWTLIKKNQKVKANFDPNTHAKLRIRIQDGPRKFTEYTVNQIACSESHEITLKASDVPQLKGGKLLEIKKAS